MEQSANRPTPRDGAPAPASYEDKLAALRARLAGLEGLLVAFSGGVDSGVLLHAARSVLGEGARGLIADSPSLPRRELAEAREFARQIGAELIEVPTDELSDPGYRQNAGDRCYYCKAALFRAMDRAAAQRGALPLAFGEIADDALDDRPGARAAAERGVLAPLAEAGFTKQDVRRYAREQRLELADKPAAACLASRIPVGTEVDAAALAQVEDAEERVRALGFRQLRVRHRGDHARLEVGADELARAEGLRAELAAELGAAGFGTSELAVYVPPAERPGPGPPSAQEHRQQPLR